MAKIVFPMMTPMAYIRRPTTNDRHAKGPWLIWAICTVARSGSSWLSQLVGSTQLLGNPEEYLLDWPRCGARFGLSAATPFEEYVSCLIRLRSTPNGVFSIKGSFAELQPFLDLFPGAPCVWLSRENKLEQAVSWHRAHDGGQWTRTDCVRPQCPFRFSVDRALWFYDEILRREALWRNFFSACEVQPLVLTYEALCRDPLAAVQTIAAHIGVDPSGIERVRSPLRIVRDEQTAGFVRRTEQALQALSTSVSNRRSPRRHVPIFSAQSRSENQCG
jgi:trehalose 2-sulfotransferase